MAISASSQLMSLTCCIIRNPTSTSAGTAASEGMIADQGREQDRDEEECPGHHRRQAGAGSLTDTRGGLDVAGVRRDTGQAAGGGATESTTRIRSAFGGMPSSSSRSPSAPIAVIVPIVSKKSASISVKTNSSAATTPTSSKEPISENSPRVPKSGFLARSPKPGRSGTVERPHLGFADRLDHDGQDRRGHDREEDRAPDLEHPQRDQQQQPEREDHHRPAGQLPVLAELYGHRRVGGVGDALHEAGVHEPDECDEQADAHRDRDLELGGMAWNTAVRKPVSTRTRITRPSMTTRPIASAQVICAGDGEGDERVEPEPRGQRQRIVGDDAHQDRHHPGHQRSTGGDRREVRRIAAAEEPAIDVLSEAEDQRVEDDDVGHRDEGDDATPDLALDRRAPLGDLEVAVDAGRTGRLGGHPIHPSRTVRPWEYALWHRSDSD